MIPTEGRIVLYALASGDRPVVAGLNAPGKIRPAVIVEAWGGKTEDTASHPNLLVFLDGQNDGVPQDHYPLMWVTSVPFDEYFGSLGHEEPVKPGHWIWPPKK